MSWMPIYPFNWYICSVLDVQLRNTSLVYRDSWIKQLLTSSLDPVIRSFQMGRSHMSHVLVVPLQIFDSLRVERSISFAFPLLLCSHWLHDLICYFSRLFPNRITIPDNVPSLETSLQCTHLTAFSKESNPVLDFDVPNQLNAVPNTQMNGSPKNQVPITVASNIVKCPDRASPNHNVQPDTSQEFFPDKSGEWVFYPVYFSDGSVAVYNKTSSETSILTANWM